MTFKPNFTDIRSFQIRDPIEIRTVGMTAANSATDWKYLTSRSAVKGTDLILTDGVLLSNIGPNAVVVSKEGQTAGTFTTGVTANGFAIGQNQSLNLKITNLADVVVKSTAASAATGITLSYLAS